MSYPMVSRRVAEGRIALHGWHYVIEEGEVHVLDVERGAFVPAGGPGRDPGDDPAREVSLLQ
jgi:carbonic anhydrase